MRCPKSRFPILIIVFDELELIIFVSQGLTLSTASLVSICCQGLWDCESPDLDQGIFNDTAICACVLDAGFLPSHLTHQASSDFILGHDSELCSHKPGSGSSPANQEISDVHQDISRAGAEGICSSRAQGSLANQKLTPLTSRPSLVLNEI